jgi:hypothetical protein
MRRKKAKRRKDLLRVCGEIERRGGRGGKERKEERWKTGGCEQGMSGVGGDGGGVVDDGLETRKMANLRHGQKARNNTTKESMMKKPQKCQCGQGLHPSSMRPLPFVT